MTNTLYIIIIFTIARWEGHLKQTIFKEWHYMYESTWFAYGTFVVCILFTEQILQTFGYLSYRSSYA